MRRRVALSLVPVAGAVLVLSLAAPGQGERDAPESWVGREFPLLDRVDFEGDLRRGDWRVLLFHHSCPKCVETLDELARTALEGSARPLACLEVPPYGEVEREAPGVQFGRVRDELRVTTPVLLTLKDGVVRDLETTSPPVRKGTGDEEGLEERLTVDLGYVAPGALEPVEFVVANARDKPLEVKRLVPECACTRVTEAPERIEPGKAGKVRVDFEAPKESLSYAKGIVVETSDTERREVRLLLRARIGLPLRVEPEILDFGKVGAGEERRGRLTVHNDGPEPVKLIYATSPGGELTVEVPQAAVRPGWSTTLPVTLRAKIEGAPGKEERAFAHIKTGLHGQRLSATARYTVAE